jgi:hypothetical protein
MNYDYLLIGIVLAYIAWRLLGALRVRRRLPELKREAPSWWTCAVPANTPAVTYPAP